MDTNLIISILFLFFAVIAYRRIYEIHKILEQITKKIENIEKRLGIKQTEKEEDEGKKVKHFF